MTDDCFEVPTGHGCTSTVRRSSLARGMAGQQRSPLERQQPDPTGTAARAGTVLEAVARRDFGGLAAALRDDVHLRALLPGDFKEWHGRVGVHEAFTDWFDDFDEYELVDAGVGRVGTRLHLRWRLRVRAARKAGRWLVVEQQVYADCDTDGQIHRLSLLCSGFRREGASD